MIKRKSRNRKNHLSARNATKSVLIYGRHAVIAALENAHRVVHHLYVSRNMYDEFEPIAQIRNIDIEIADTHRFTQLVPSHAVHQGVILHADVLPVSTLDAACASRKLLIIADQITDPHNIGAILRSAAIFDAAALVQTRRHAPPMDSVLIKAASGAVDMIPLIAVSNLVRALVHIKQAGYFVIGLEEHATASLADIPRDIPLALVLGGEGGGLRRLTRAHCDLSVHIPLPAVSGVRLTTLNVSNAAAIALYALTISIRQS